MNVCRYVLWEDGASEWSLLPADLHNHLIGRQRSKSGVASLSVGHGGAWMVGFRDGSWLGKRIPDGLANAIESVTDGGSRLLAVELHGSDHDGWVLIYG